MTGNITASQAMESVIASDVIRKQLITSLLSNLESFDVYDIGSSGGLKPGSLEFLVSFPDARMIQFDISSVPVDTSFSEWYEKHRTDLSGKTIAIPFLAGCKEHRCKFNITKDPRCSSVLAPDISRLSKYHDINRFQIVRQLFAPVTTIDIVSGLLCATPAFIKIDAQGYDLEVLKGATGVMSGAKPWILVEMNTMDYYINQASLSQLSGFLEDHGYRLKRIYPAKHYTVATGRGPYILNFMDALWCPSDEVLPPSFSSIASELILRLGFHLCYDQSTMSLLSTLGLNDMAPHIQEMGSKLREEGHAYVDHIV